MKLLEAGGVRPDPWVVIEAGSPLPNAPVIVPLSDLDRAAGHAHPVGVLLTPEIDPQGLRPVFAQIALVAVQFPIFRDGRGFTQARSLREYAGFTGTIRAQGHLLPDQYQFLRRCGVDSVALPDDADLAVWEAALLRFDVGFQRGWQDGPQIGHGLARRLG